MLGFEFKDSKLSLNHVFISRNSWLIFILKSVLFDQVTPQTSSAFGPTCATHTLTNCKTPSTGTPKPRPLLTHRVGTPRLDRSARPLHDHCGHCIPLYTYKLQECFHAYLAEFFQRHWPGLIYAAISNLLRTMRQGRIKLFGAPRQWKHFRPLFQAVFLSGGESNTTPPSPKTKITTILFYILNFASIIKFKM